MPAKKKLLLQLWNSGHGGGFRPFQLGMCWEVFSQRNQLIDFQSVDAMT